MLNFTVGPVMSDPTIIEVANHSTPYFRTPEFSNLMKENEKLMLSSLSAPKSSRCVFLTASGTGAMESVVMNVLNDQDKVLIINGGSFGQRFVDLCRLHKRTLTEIKLPFGCSLKKEQLMLYDNQNYTALLVNMHETSSGVLYNMPMISEFCKKNNILLIIDAISAFLAENLPMEEWAADVVITGSQKALAVQPGVSVIALSEKAICRIEFNKEQCMYLSLKEALNNGVRGQTPFTPAVTTLLQIHQRLIDIEASGGVSQEQKKISDIAQSFRNGIKDLPLEILADCPSNAVTALLAKKSNAKQIVQILKDNFDIWVCPNGGEWSDKVFRVGHIGYITSEDNNKLISALHTLNKNLLL